MGGHDYLFEVRFDELPPQIQQPAIRQLASRIFEVLMGIGLTPAEIITGATLRRLVICLKDLPSHQPAQQRQELGPPASEAYDDEGQPTAALLGFAERVGAAPEALETVETEKGPYVTALRQVGGRPCQEVLTTLVPRLLGELEVGELMRWGGGSGPWLRPVRSILSLYDGEVLPFTFCGVEAGARSTGHPHFSPRPFKVGSFAVYLQRLAKLGIEINATARHRTLEELLSAAAAALGGRLENEGALLDRLAARCEIPGVVSGRFDPVFLDLPEEVIRATLEDQNSAFVPRGEDGALLPAFLTVMDRPDDPEGRVRAGYERAVAGRLADARFAYQADRQTPLAERARRQAAEVVEIPRGTCGERASRLTELVTVLCGVLGWEEEKAPARQAAALLKADLTTRLVNEHGALRGVAGGVYAREEGYVEAVWQALYDQYLPLVQADPIPRGRVGRVLAVADRLDTLVGYFGNGSPPTPRRDPYRLRGVAQGLVRILIEGGLELDVDLMLARNALLYGSALAASADETVAALQPFLLERIRQVLGSRGYAFDEIEAAIAIRANNLPDLEARVAALAALRNDDSFHALVRAAKRIFNIVKDSAEHELDSGLLTEPAELALYATYETVRDEVEAAVAERRYEAALRSMEALAQGLDRFFVEVLVMDEHAERRHNRIALLQAIRRVFWRMARLKEMAVDRPPEST